MTLYQQYEPHPALSNYIDAYWTVTSHGKDIQTEKILPDGCVDIIFNLGDHFTTDNGDFILQHEKIYLVGTMTRFKENSLHAETRLLGIRFKPAGFGAFYQFGSLHEINNQTIPFENKVLPDLYKLVHFSTGYLDQFFLHKFTKPKHRLLPVVMDIQHHSGRVNIAALAKRHYITERQLERSFKTHIGVSPKEFSNLVRYQSTLPIIQNKTSTSSLADIAFEQGYYDHAHLTNEIKRYTGLSPSQF